MPEFCKSERDGHVLIVTINRPERMNALHSPAHFELSKIFDDFESGIISFARPGAAPCLPDENGCGTLGHYHKVQRHTWAKDRWRR